MQNDDLKPLQSGRTVLPVYIDEHDFLAFWELRLSLRQLLLILAVLGGWFLSARGVALLLGITDTVPLLVLAPEAIAGIVHIYRRY